MNTQNAIIPQPRCSVSIRPAAADDLGFIDALQKAHTHMVGFLHRKALEQKLAAGQVLVAEEVSGNEPRASASGSGMAPSPSGRGCLRSEAKQTGEGSGHGPLPHGRGSLGYVISHDQYCGRDDVGIIFQLNVAPLKQRHLVGAMLVKAVFEKAAYGCRLFSCWCAQDIQANFFWESIGFVPLAFRTGTRAKQRTHIFWQKRIRENDTTTPWWFPSQTRSGAFREDRLVFPIPVGMHWRDPMPVVLPRLQEPPPLPDTLPGGAPVRPRPEQPKITNSQKLAVVRAQSKHLQGTPAGKASVVTASGLRYIERGDHEPDPVPEKPKRIPRPPAPKHDPADIAKVRELRDRYLEEINRDGALLTAAGKYEVARALPQGQRVVVVPAVPALLPAAA